MEQEIYKIDISPKKEQDKKNKDEKRKQSPLGRKFVTGKHGLEVARQLF